MQIFRNELGELMEQADRVMEEFIEGRDEISMRGLDPIADRGLVLGANCGQCGAIIRLIRPSAVFSFWRSSFD